MTDRDPDIQREVDRAVTWWTRYLQPRLVAGVDAEDIARRGVEAMYAEHWRPLRPPPDWKQLRDQKPADPTPEWREARDRLRGRQ